MPLKDRELRIAYNKKYHGEHKDELSAKAKEKRKGRPTYDKKCYEGHKKEIVAKAKKYRENHPDYDKKYYEKHKEEIAAKAKKRREERLVYKKKYKEEHKEEIAAKVKKRREARLVFGKKYREENKEELSAKAKKRREEHPEIFKERHHRYQIENKEKIRIYLKKQGPGRRYGLKKEEYDKMNTKQEGKCAICGKDNIKKWNIVALCVDHNHKTGKIRGLLCANCNSLLGFMDDNLEIFPKMRDYLSKYMGE